MGITKTLVKLGLAVFIICTSAQGIKEGLESKFAKNLIQQSINGREYSLQMKGPENIDYTNDMVSYGVAGASVLTIYLCGRLAVPKLK